LGEGAGQRRNPLERGTAALFEEIAAVSEWTYRD
jgi:hypothetical protein